MTVDQPIRDAFPGPDPVSRSVRVALLKVLHAGLWAELQLEFVRNYLADMISDPPYSIWYGPVNPHTLAGALRSLASELDRAEIALNAAKPHWQLFAHAAETADVGIRRPESSNDSETPF